MRRILVAVASMTWLACGSSKPGEGGAIGNAAPDAGPRVLPPLAAGCPATMAEAAGTCSWEQSPSNCQWAEGQCHCGYPMVCSGAAVNPDEVPAEPPTWQCAAWPPAVRADGCPGEIGGRCSDEGKQCTYGSCCVATYTCVKGEWRETAAECPP
jgi:hypothetical protein